MQLASHVTSLQEQLASAVALGGTAAAEAGERLAAALEAALRVRFQEALAEAAAELSLPDGHVEVRLAGGDPQLVYVDHPDEPAAPHGDALTARITLRLPEGLKARAEAAAAREGVSTNAWLVRAIARALEPRRPNVGRRITGFAQT